MTTAATTTKVASLAFKTPTLTHRRCVATMNEEMSGKGPSLTTPRRPPAPEPTTRLARSFHHRLALPSREKDKLPGGTPSQPRGKDDSVALLSAELSLNDRRRLGADQPFDRGRTCTPRGRSGGRIDSPQDESTPEHSPAVVVAETAESQCSRHVAGRPPQGQASPRDRRPWPEQLPRRATAPPLLYVWIHASDPIGTRPPALAHSRHAVGACLGHRTADRACRRPWHPPLRLAQA